jgi:hypothetical protein
VLNIVCNDVAASHEYLHMKASNHQPVSSTLHLIKMIPTPDSNTTAQAMAFLELKCSVVSATAPSATRALMRLNPSTPLARPTTSSLARLAPETRNTIYEFIFDTPQAYFVVATDGAAPSFRLRDRSDQSQYDAVHVLQALGLVDHEIRREARTFFYASKHFIVLPCGYDYLSVFVHWLYRVGAECRAVLRKVCFAGYMWYQPSLAYTRRFHGLLRSCTNLRRLTVQMNIWHLCESCTSNLDAYLSMEGPGPYDGPMPQVDISVWAETIARLHNTHTVRLDIIMSVDRKRDSCIKEKDYMYFIGARGSALAEDVERRLRERIEGMDIGRDVELFVKYMGTDERVYFGNPW